MKNTIDTKDKLEYWMQKAQDAIERNERKYVNENGEYIGEKLAKRIRAFSNAEFVERIERGVPKIENYFRTKTDFKCDRVEDSEMAKIYRWVTQMQIANIEGDANLRPTRGLLIVGPAGRGKTKMLETLFRAFEHKKDDNRKGYRDEKTKSNCEYTPAEWISFQTVSACTIARDCDTERCVNGFADYLDNERPLLLDDVGSEPQVKYYGNEPVMQSFLMDLYNAYRMHGKLVVMTSNLSTQENSSVSFNAMYGKRIHSRISEMFEIVKFTKGGDMRQEQRTAPGANIESRLRGNYEPLFESSF